MSSTVTSAYLKPTVDPSTQYLPINDPVTDTAEKCTRIAAKKRPFLGDGKPIEIPPFDWELPIHDFLFPLPQPSTSSPSDVAAKSEAIAPKQKRQKAGKHTPRRKKNEAYDKAFTMLHKGELDLDKIAESCKIGKDQFRRYKSTIKDCFILQESGQEVTTRTIEDLCQSRGDLNVDRVEKWWKEASDLNYRSYYFDLKPKELPKITGRSESSIKKEEMDEKYDLAFELLHAGERIYKIVQLCGFGDTQFLVYRKAIAACLQLKAQGTEVVEAEIIKICKKGDPTSVERVKKWWAIVVDNPDYQKCYLHLMVPKNSPSKFPFIPIPDKWDPY